uniref:Uncharacterized protein n=1 Tax=Lygus hesperus TaxID=30085 RepID=A0A0K8S3K1_LYGHE
MNRKLRGTLPVDANALNPQWPGLKAFRTVDEKRKEQQRTYFDERHGAKGLRNLREEEVWVREARKYGTVRQQIEEVPRRYEVKTSDGATLLRNRKLLVPEN